METSCTRCDGCGKLCENHDTTRIGHLIDLCDRCYATVADWFTHNTPDGRSMLEKYVTTVRAIVTEE